MKYLLFPQGVMWRCEPTFSCECLYILCREAVLVMLPYNPHPHFFTRNPNAFNRNSVGRERKTRWKVSCLPLHFQRENFTFYTISSRWDALLCLCVSVVTQCSNVSVNTSDVTAPTAWSETSKQMKRK